tara:strand:- start:332 stop:490 length:159 start_codon:yes stop_codon:yes gene_type:complete
VEVEVDILLEMVQRVHLVVVAVVMLPDLQILVEQETHLLLVLLKVMLVELVL